MLVSSRQSSVSELEAVSSVSELEAVSSSFRQCLVLVSSSSKLLQLIRLTKLVTPSQCAAQWIKKNGKNLFSAAKLTPLVLILFLFNSIY